MADEIKKIITIDTGQGITSLKEYKKHIDELRGSLLQLDKESEEYVETEKEIEREQNKLNEVLSAGKKQVDLAEGSYYKLNQQLIEAKKQWKSLSEQERNSDVGKTILGNITNLDKQLKGLDASIGQYQRNVGNYGSAFSGAFSAVKNEIAKAVPAVGKLNAGFKALTLNPVGAVMAAVAAAIAAVVKSMKSSESQFNRFKVATAGVHAVFDGLKNVLSKVSEGFVKLVEKANELAMKVLVKLKDIVAGLGWDKMANNLTNVIAKIEEYQELEEKSQDLGYNRRKTLIAIAKLENQTADLRAKIADKEKYSEEERLKFINDWEKAEKQRAGLMVSLAQAEYNEIKKKNSLTESSTADLDAENDAYVNLIKTQGQYSESIRTITKQKNTLISEINAKAIEQEKAETEAIKKLTDAEVERQKAEESNYKKEHERDLNKLDSNAAQDLFTADIEIDNEQEKAQRIYEINRKLLEDKIALQQTYVDGFLGGIDEQIAAEQELVSMKQELANLDIKRAKDVADYETKVAKETAKNKENNYKQLVSSTSSLFGALSDLYEEGSQEQKTFAIMEATINTIASVVGVIKSVWSDTTIPSVIAKAALTATMGGSVLASGIAQIKKIQGVTKNSSSTPEASGINASVPAIPNVGVSPLLNEEADIQRLQTLSVSPESNTDRNTRVYVVESDITESQDNMKVKIANSTF